MPSAIDFFHALIEVATVDCTDASSPGILLNDSNAQSPSTHTVTTANLAALIVVGTLGAAPVVIGPVLVAGMLEQLALTPRQAGVVVGAEMAGIGLATLFAVFVAHRLNRRWMLLSGLVLLAIAHFGSSLVAKQAIGGAAFAALAAIWLVGGLGSGTATATMKAAIAGSHTPDRAFACYSILLLVFGAAALPLATRLRLESGIASVYGAMALLTVIVMPLARWWPPRPAAQTPPRLLAPATRWGTIGAIASLGAYFLAYSAVWPYIERIGVASGLGSGAAGNAVGFALACGALGAVAAMLSAARPAQRTALLTLGLAVGIASMAALTAGHETWFRYAAAAFAASAFFVLPLLLGALAARDSSGRALLIGLVVQSACMALAPVIAGQLAQDGGYLRIPLQGVVGYACALLLVLGTRLSRY